jgi:hypothetical protein
LIVAKPDDQFYTDARSVNERILAGSWRVPCTIRDATAIGWQNVCWRLKKHANLITANFISHVGACSHVVASGTVFNA